LVAKAKETEVKPAAEKDWRLTLAIFWLPYVKTNPIGLALLPTTFYLSVAYWDQFQRSLLLPMFGIYLLRELVSMSICLHRYFSHKGFRVSRPTQLVLWWTACLAYQGSPLWWAANHRRHHKHCDTKEDPHSPVAHHPLYAWQGWLFYEAIVVGVQEEYIRDLLATKELAWLESFYFIPILAELAGMYYYGGLPWVVFVALWSGSLCMTLTTYFNVMFHLHSDTTDTCKAQDKPLELLSHIFGEAYHHWHHVHPRAYHRPGLDVPYYAFILPLLTCGLFSGPNLMGAKEL